MYLPPLASKIGGAPGRSRYTHGSDIPSNISENIRIQGYFFLKYIGECIVVEKYEMLIHEVQTRAVDTLRRQGEKRRTGATFFQEPF